MVGAATRPPPERRLLVVSPHFDDGVLSLGASLALLVAEGWRVRVLSVFGGGPAAAPSEPARAFHHRCGLGDDAMQVRAAEDRAACATLGVEPQHGRLPEALYRCDRDGAPRYRDGRDIFAASPSLEADVVDGVVGLVENAASGFRPSVVVAPLGVGEHVDHLITRSAVAACALGAVRRRWFEDVPYVLYDHLRGWETHHTADMHATSLHVGAAAWAAKCRAVACYASQLDVLWYDSAPWPHQLERYATDVGGGRAAERWWS